MKKMFKDFTGTTDPVQEFRTWYASQSVSVKADLDSSIVFINAQGAGAAIYAHGRMYEIVGGSGSVAQISVSLGANATEASGNAKYIVPSVYTSTDISAKVYEVDSITGVNREVDALIEIESDGNNTNIMVHMHPGIGDNVSIPADTYRLVYTTPTH